MTTLPKGIQEQIESEANEQYPIEGRMQASTHNSQIEQRKGFIAGAKNYATQLHTLQQENERLRRALRSLVLSVTAHPDYTEQDNEEWTDLVDTANAALTAQPEADNQQNENV